MQPWIFHPGDHLCAESEALEGTHSAFFEDDGETGYFYACDNARDDSPILDAVFIYNVKDVKDRDRASELMIYWSNALNKCALTINGYPHGAFDFEARRGFCRADFPNFKESSNDLWPQQDHSWSDSAVSWLYERQPETSACKGTV